MNPKQQPEREYEGADNNNSSVIKIHHDHEYYFKSLPPGYRFCPYDDELLHYLHKKVHNHNLDINQIHELNFYHYNPDQLAKKTQPAVGRKEWYFFTPRDRRCQNGKRPNRKAIDGFWKATAGDMAVISKGQTLGYKMTLVFYKGKPPGKKTNWIMKEFRLANPPRVKKGPNDMRLDDCVLCKLYMKQENRSKRGEECEEVGCPAIQSNVSEMKFNFSCVGGLVNNGSQQVAQLTDASAQNLPNFNNHLLQPTSLNYSCWPPHAHVQPIAFMSSKPPDHVHPTADCYNDHVHCTAERNCKPSDLDHVDPNNCKPDSPKEKASDSKQIESHQEEDICSIPMSENCDSPLDLDLSDLDISHLSSILESDDLILESDDLILDDDIFNAAFGKPLWFMSATYCAPHQMK